MYKWVTRAGVALGATAIAIPLIAGTAVANPSPEGSTRVNVIMQSSTGAVLDIPNDGSASVYYHGSWQAIDGVNSNNHSMVWAKLEPGTYTFAATYNGTRDQKVVTIGTSTKSVYFHTASVNIELQAHNNSALDIPANGSASYYAGGWHAITDQNPNNPRMVQAEMLPGTYTFAATYNGTRDQKVYTVERPNVYSHANQQQTVYFHAARVNIALQSLNCEGHVDGFVYGQNQSYYAGGWHAITTPNGNNPKMVTAEMLPGKYWFAAQTSDASVQGARYQKQATIVEPNPNNHANATQSVYFSFAAANCTVAGS